MNEEIKKLCDENEVSHLLDMILNYYDTPQKGGFMYYSPTDVTTLNTELNNCIKNITKIERP